MVTSENPGVYAILRSNASEKILVLMNLTKSAINDYNLSLNNLDVLDGQYQPGPLMGPGVFATLNVSNHGFSNYKPIDQLSPYSILIFTLRP